MTQDELIQQLAAKTKMQDQVIEMLTKDNIAFRKTLKKIADIEVENIPAPTSSNEAITWVTLERAVALAETALKGDE